jgi:hypothetical protein
MNYKLNKEIKKKLLSIVFLDRLGYIAFYDMSARVETPGKFKNLDKEKRGWNHDQVGHDSDHDLCLR